jgi:hypothetical protein
MDNYEFKIGVEPTDKYEKAKKDLLQALKSFGELLPIQKEYLIKEILGATNVEILCNRESGVGYASLFFSDGTGWMLRNDDSRLQIFPDGHIELGMNWPHRTITIDPNSIRLGDGAHPAAYGDEVANILMKICGLLQNAAKAAKTTPYTMALAPIFDCAKTIQEDIPGVKSAHIQID